MVRQEGLQARNAVLITFCFVATEVGKGSVFKVFCLLSKVLRNLFDGNFKCIF